VKTTVKSNSRPLPRALWAIVLGVAAIWAMPRNARAQVLYVGQSAINSVGEYDASTGAAINASFITGVGGSPALVLSGNDLFVENGNTLSEYNATTGLGEYCHRSARDLAAY
jgi:hypothetical protein